MSVVRGILAEEKARLEALIAKYEERIAALPAGAVRVRRIGERSFLYRNRREGLHVLSEYLGSAEGDEAQRVLELDRQRRHYKERRRAALAELAEVRRALGRVAA